MISKNFKTLKKINGKEYIFHTASFRYHYNKALKFAKKVNIKKTELDFREDLADLLNVSASAIKQWKLGNNGIGDITLLNEIANYFIIDENELLIQKEEPKEITIMKTEPNSNTTINETEKNAIREIYQSFVHYMDIFKETAGYTYFDYGCPYSRLDGYESQHNYYITVRKSMLDIPRDLYKKLLHFIDDLNWEDETEINIFETEEYLSFIDNDLEGKNIIYNQMAYIDYLEESSYSKIEQLLIAYRF